MSVAAIDPERCCLACKERLARKRYGDRLESMNRFKQRNFCGVSCSRTASVQVGEGTSTMTLHLSTRQKKALLELAVSTKQSMSQLIRQAIYQFVHSLSTEKLQ